MTTFAEFRKKVLKVNEKRTVKITNSYGSADAFRYINKELELPKITLREFRNIINTVNKILVKRFIEGHDIKFPKRMGNIELWKHTPTFKNVNGKIKTTLKIDWKRTLEYWNNNEEAYKNKTILKKETDTIFRIVYNKSKAMYVNKQFFRFIPSRSFKSALKEAIRNNSIDAFTTDKYELYKH